MFAYMQVDIVRVDCAVRNIFVWIFLLIRHLTLDTPCGFEHELSAFCLYYLLPSRQKMKDQHSHTKVDPCGGILRVES